MLVDDAAIRESEARMDEVGVSGAASGLLGEDLEADGDEEDKDDDSVDGEGAGAFEAALSEELLLELPSEIPPKSIPSLRCPFRSFGIDQKASRQEL